MRRLSGASRGAPADGAAPVRGLRRARSRVAARLVAGLLLLGALFAFSPLAHAQTTINENSELVPSGLVAGDTFRLIFLSSTRRGIDSNNIGTYNAFVQTRAAAGHADIQAFSAEFMAVGSTASVHARNNTSTTYTNADKGVPIYWVKGTKVADDYEDFYDGNWDDEANDKNESGADGPNTSDANWFPATGSKHNGTRFTSGGSLRVLGSSLVRVGRPNSSAPGHGPLSSEANRSGSSASSPFYGLSPVLTVVGNTAAIGEPAITGVAQDRKTLTADATGIMDDDGVPATLTYQWVRVDGSSNETDIMGATNSTYTLTTSDVDNKIRVKVSFNDDGGTDETRTSDAYPSYANVMAAKGTCPTDTDWCATLKSGYDSSATAIAISHEFGYIPGSSFGGLSPAMFTHGGTDYTVTEVYRNQNTSLDGTTVLIDGFSITVTGDMGETLPDGTVLDVGGQTLTVGTGTATATAGREGWNLVTLGISFNWVEDGEVAVSLKLPGNTPATVSGVAVTSNPDSGDTYGTGETIEFTVTFSEAVTVTGGPPTFEFKLGPMGSGVETAATFDTSTSGTDALVFTYTVQTGDTDPNGIWIGNQSNTLKLNSATIRSNGVDANLDHAAPGTQSGHKVDGSSTVSAPSLPTSVNAIARNTQVNLQWQPSEDNGGAPLDCYYFRHKESTDTDYGDWSSCINASGATYSEIISGLTNGTEYSFQVRAHNTAGLYSLETDAVTATPRWVPGRPQNVAASPGTADGSVMLSWEPPTSNGGAEITRYEYRYKTTGTYPDTWTTVTGGGSARSVTVFNLTNGTLHTFQVRARNVAGDGAARSVTATPTGTAVESLGRPSLDAAAGNRRVTLSWGAPSSDGGSAIVHYESRYKSSSGSYNGWSPAPGGATARGPLTVTGLANGTRYTFQVRAVNGNGDGPEAEASATPYAREFPAVSVADAATDEGDRLAFRVTLDRASDKSLSVDWTTRDGTAVAGTDYTAGSGKLGFAPGETVRTVRIATLEDNADDDEETMTLVLSNPNGATLADATATGTIGEPDPATVSVHATETVEGAGAVLSFPVRLDRAAARTVTVDWETVDGNAKAGADYTARSGTLTFTAGETDKTVDVTVLADDHDEGTEFMFLLLSNVQGARRANPLAKGRIKNSGPMPKALMARFGRTAAVHVVEHVEARLHAPRAPGFEGRIAGHELRPGMERELARNFVRQLWAAGGSHSPMSGAADPGMHETPGLAGGGVATASAGPLGAAGGTDPMSGGAGGFNGRGLLMSLGHRDVLMSSDFALNRETRGGVLSFWSRGAQSNFSGREGALSLGGDVRTTMVGADYAKGPLVAGLSLSHSRGLGEYVGVTGGQVGSSVTGLYPWLGYQVTDRVSVWGVTGYGAGGLWLTPNGGPALRSGLSMAMAAAGTRGELVAGGAGGFALAFKADALWVGTSIDGVDGVAGRLAATDAAVTRFRTGLEGSRAYTLAGRLSLRPSVEVGLRHDGGDAETGAGMDVGAGLVMADAATGLAVDVRVRTLLVHQAEGFRERGLAVSLSYNPTPSTPLGLTARVAPSWGGQAQSGAEALWGRETMAGMAHGGVADGTRLDADIGYGLPVGSRFVGTPTVGVGTSADGRDYRLGYRLGALGGAGTTVEFGVDAQRRERLLVGGTDHGARAQATVGW